MDECRPTNLETLSAVRFLENQSPNKRSPHVPSNDGDHVTEDEPSKEELIDIMPDSSDMIYKVVSDENGLFDVSDLQLQPGQTLCEIDDGDGNITYQLIENGQVLLSASQEELVCSDQDVREEVATDTATEMAMAAQDEDSHMALPTSLSGSFSSDMLLGPVYASSPHLESGHQRQGASVEEALDRTKSKEAEASRYLQNDIYSSSNSPDQTSDWTMMSPCQGPNTKSIFRLKLKSPASEEVLNNASHSQTNDSLQKYYVQLKELKQRCTVAENQSDRDKHSEDRVTFQTQSTSCTGLVGPGSTNHTFVRYKCPVVRADGSGHPQLHGQYATVPITSLADLKAAGLSSSYIMIRHPDGTTKLIDRGSFHSLSSPHFSKSRPLQYSASQQVLRHRCIQTPVKNIGNILLNSSGSEEDPSPPSTGRSGMWPPQPTLRTPMEGVTSNPASTMSLPTAAQIQAAFLRVQREPLDSSDLCLGRQQHNAKERARRARIKFACDQLRTLVPGMTGKTDKATVFEFAVQYLNYLKGFISDKCDKEFLEQVGTYEITDRPDSPDMG